MPQPLRRRSAFVDPPVRRNRPTLHAIGEADRFEPIDSPALALQRRLAHRYAGGHPDTSFQPPRYSRRARVTALAGSSALLWWCIFAGARALIG